MGNDGIQRGERFISDTAKAPDTPLPPVRAAEEYLPQAGHHPGLCPVDEAWADRVLADMPVDELIGQLFISADVPGGEEEIERFHVGGFYLLGNSQRAADIAEYTNRLQGRSRFPLWFFLDSEAGIGSRVADGTMFPLPMAFGAANRPGLARRCGAITARESRAIGVQVTTAPTVDVLTEPGNPIISTRAYADDADRVAVLAEAYIHGAHAEGALTSLKHYPGHGAAAGDSHHALPAVSIGEDELFRVHLAPYRVLIERGLADMVMTAHLDFPAIAAAGEPATILPYFMRELLRERLGHTGPLLSDSLEMRGFINAVPDVRERAVRCLMAGLDALVSPGVGNIGPMIEGIHAALEDGRLELDQLRASARRILLAKSRSGLHQERYIQEDGWTDVLNHPDHRAAAREVCEASFTELKCKLCEPSPLRKEDKVLVLALAGTQRIFHRFPPEPLREGLARRLPNMEFREVPVELDAPSALAREAARFDRVLVAGFDWWKIAAPAQVELITKMTNRGVAVVYTSFGAPTHLAQIPNVPAFYCAYATIPEAQRTAARVLCGEIPPGTRECPIAAG